MLVAAGDGSLVTFLVSDGLLELSEIKAQGKEARIWLKSMGNPWEIHGKCMGHAMSLSFFLLNLQTPEVVARVFLKLQNTTVILEKSMAYHSRC